MGAGPALRPCAPLVSGVTGQDVPPPPGASVLFHAQFRPRCQLSPLHGSKKCWRWPDPEALPQAPLPSLLPQRWQPCLPHTPFRHQSSSKLPQEPSRLPQMAASFGRHLLREPSMVTASQRLCPVGFQKPPGDPERLSPPPPPPAAAAEEVGAGPSLTLPRRLDPGGPWPKRSLPAKAASQGGCGQETLCSSEEGTEESLRLLLQPQESRTTKLEIQTAVCEWLFLQVSRTPQRQSGSALAGTWRSGR